MRRKRRVALAALFLAGFLGVSQPMHAQVQVVIGRLLLHGGKWLAGAVSGYLLGKEIDKARGEDFETKLKEAQVGLIEEMKRGSSDMDVLQVELDAVRSQLAMLDTLMRGRPTEQQLKDFRRQLATDIEQILKILRDHGVRIEKLEDDMTSVLARLDSLERARTDSSARSSRIEGSESPRPTLNNNPWSRTTGGLPQGVTLEISVTGGSNSVRVSETDAWETADLGSFSLSGGEQRASFRLLRKTGAVIILSGHDHIVVLAQSLCGRTRVIDRSRGSEVIGCK